MLDAKVSKLSDICDGKLETKFQEKLKEAIENVYDQRYNPNDVRTITMKVKLYPEPADQAIGMMASVEFVKPAAKPIKALCHLTKVNGVPGIYTSDPNQFEMFNQLNEAVNERKGE